ncbi:SDR family oxidoreductase [Aspergillus stella-maris]|uniref:SDR family oxidoreductase n=1 Tax=Aspergillus stella-maris TaxID=1810926 RepID=UPI003CCDBD49
MTDLIPCITSLQQQIACLLTILPLKSIAAIGTFIVLRYINTSLSREAQNNWVKSAPWNPSNEIALVTGGSSGIGRQIVRDLARLGVKAVVIWDVREPEGTLPSNVHFYKVDITSPATIASAATTLRAQHGHPTILINNAGIAYANSVLCLSEEEIRRTLQVNTHSHFWTIREFLPDMVEMNHGHIVTMASMASFSGCAGLVAYSASKAALLGVHEGVSQEIRHIYRDGDDDGERCRVRTSIIHPLYVATPMTSVLQENKSRFRRPFITAGEVSDAVVRQIVRGDSGQVIVPESQWAVAWLRGMPGWVQEVVRDWGSRGFVRLRDQMLNGAS